MNNISLKSDDIRTKMYEVSCLMKCFYKIFKINATQNKDCLFLIPLSKMTYKKYKKLGLIYNFTPKVVKI